METEIAKIDGSVPTREIFERAGQIIRDGGLVAFPTETVYGLGGNAFDPEASARIYAAKGRPSDNPLIVHISDLSQLESVALEVPETARRLAETFWPGPMTLILPKRPEVPDATTGGLQTVAVRFPSHPAARALIDAAGVPIAAPSANLSGRPSPTSAEHVAEDLTGRVAMILDGGPCSIGLESTIIDCTSDEPVILRPGYILPEQVEELVGSVELDRVVTADSAEEAAVPEGPKAPGMKYRHYAPSAPLKLFEGEREAVVKRIIALARGSMDAGQKVGVLCSEETRGSYQVALSGGLPSAAVRSFGSVSEPEQAAASLFALLREMDAEGVCVIYAETLPEEGLGASVMNRLKKAAGFDIEHVRSAEPKAVVKTGFPFSDVIFADRGNTTYSVICESIAAFLCRGSGIAVHSRGTSVLFSEPVNEKAVRILADHGLRPARAETKLLESKDISETTLILTSDESVKRKILRTFPEANFVLTVAEFAGESEGPDMPAGGREQYEALYQDLLRLLTKAAGRMLDDRAEREETDGENV
ncbi:MAG: threonylcarbamoyl-AMP synthase [Lachnospiraceae bacterium]|nr:threonylcarbamoyl-AMP synthase [Lachnospiraceae bacterium]